MFPQSHSIPQKERNIQEIMKGSVTFKTLVDAQYDYKPKCSTTKLKDNITEFRLKRRQNFLRISENSYLQRKRMKDASA